MVVLLSDVKDIMWLDGENKNKVSSKSNPSQKSPSLPRPRQPRLPIIILALTVASYDVRKSFETVLHSHSHSQPIMILIANNFDTLHIIQ